MVKKSQQAFIKFQTYAARPWFAYALGFLALIDNFIFIFPVVPVFAGAILAVPKKWFSISTWTIIGNTIGGSLFSLFVSVYGISFIQRFLPHMMEMKAWELSKNWVETYGSGALLINSALPMVDHPMIAILTLAGEPVLKVALVLLIAKSVKYYFIGWAASFAPHLLGRLKAAAKND